MWIPNHRLIFCDVTAFVNIADSYFELENCLKVSVCLVR